MKIKAIIISAILAAALLIFAGCTPKLLTCDNCGKEVKVPSNSNMEEDWIIYCEECNEELFAGDPLLDPNA